MPITLQHAHDNVFRMDIGGLMRKRDLAECEQRLVGEIRRLGSVRLLIALDGFEGWEARDDWNDLTFYIRHGDAIERIAIVGPERWQDLALMFASADLRRAPVEYFLPAAADTARAWISQKPE